VSSLLFKIKNRKGESIMMSQDYKDRLFPIVPGLSKRFGTPFHIYDEMGIRQMCQRLKKAFEGIPFKEYFAVKACPNPAILRIVRSEGFGFDCSSIAELILARMQGATEDDIMFTSNNTSRAEFEAALSESGCILNLDDITMVSKVPGTFPHRICFRYNPGKRRTGNEIIGKPEEAKYGVTHEQIVEAYRLAMERGAKRFGLHTMVCSNERDYKYMVETVRGLLGVVKMVSKQLGIKFDFVNMGGGVGIPYHPDHKEVDIEKMAEEIKVLMFGFFSEVGYMPTLNMECGRCITGPYGALVMKVINQKHTYKEFRGVDGCMSSLMRPAMYDAHHEINVLDSRGKPVEGRGFEVVDVVGSLCENNDKFAHDRLLPRMEEGDYVVIEDTGAHGIAMGFNYNGRLRPAELLLQESATVVQIARHETPEDLFVRYM
jgi:diaminopimelate decarboxylase